MEVGHKIGHSFPMANRQKIEVARVGEYWIRVHVDTDTFTQERVLPAAFTLDGLHPEFVKKMGPHVVWSIDELSVDERRCAFETGAKILVEVDASGLVRVGGVHHSAAEWAAKHGGEISGKFWPDIPETTRKRIRGIVARAFLDQRSMRDVVIDIRNAVILGGENPLLGPTDLRKPECPYCLNALKKIPGAKTKCSQCGQFMYVRTRPEDNARVVVTEAEAHRIEERWKIKIMEGARELDDLATMIAKTETSMAQVHSNLEVWKKAGVTKIKWLAHGSDPCPECEMNDGVVREIGQEFPSGDKYPLAHPSCYCYLQAVLED